MTQEITPDIRLEGLTIGYGKTAVVSDINAVLPGGKISVILGGSGCGKSTLLKHILMLQPALGGRIMIGAHDLAELDRRGMHCLRQRMGVLFQDGAMLGSLTLGDNVALPLREHTRLDEKTIRERVLAKLALVGLEDFYDYYPNELSGGMRKRAAIARAIALEPEVLFLDEPTSGLDPITARGFDRLVRSLVDDLGLTVFLVTHDLDTLLGVVDRLIVLARGKVLADGTVAQVVDVDDEWVRSYFSVRRMTQGNGHDGS